MKQAPSLSQNDVTVLAETFRLLGDPTRLRILLFCLPGPKSVGDIVESLGLSQTLVSHHLRLLRGARLVRGASVKAGFLRSGRQSRERHADRHGNPHRRGAL